MRRYLEPHIFCGNGHDAVIGVKQLSAKDWTGFALNFSGLLNSKRDPAMSPNIAPSIEKWPASSSSGWRVTQRPLVKSGMPTGAPSGSDGCLAQRRCTSSLRIINVQRWLLTVFYAVKKPAEFQPIHTVMSAADTLVQVFCQMGCSY